RGPREPRWSERRSGALWSRPHRPFRWLRPLGPARGSECGGRSMSWASAFWGSARYRKPPSKPPPKHGIAVEKIGTTWWGRLWIEALEGISRGWSNRLARGRTYARGGRVHDLELARGGVKARVTGSRVYR